jgi:hypothetical protein
MHHSQRCGGARRPRSSRVRRLRAVAGQGRLRQNSPSACSNVAPARRPLAVASGCRAEAGRAGDASFQLLAQNLIGPCSAAVIAPSACAASARRRRELWVAGSSRSRRDQSAPKHTAWARVTPPRRVPERQSDTTPSAWLPARICNTSSRARPINRGPIQQRANTARDLWRLTSRGGATNGPWRRR